ncbi:MAG: hypothetical protein IT371_17330 [Deltaproteobacteria bacterium]|nr:hypothetical protein [Deltaproteobacteria bacterium]
MPASLDRVRHRLRPFLPLLLVAGMVLILGRYLSRQPSAVEVVFHYGPAREGLLSARISYRNGAEELHRVSFSYVAASAGPTQAHRIRLPDGDYDVLVGLTYRGQPPRAVQPDSTTPPGGSVALRRPLRVRGEGQVTIFIAEDP